MRRKSRAVFVLFNVNEVIGRPSVFQAAVEIAQLFQDGPVHFLGVEQRSIGVLWRGCLDGRLAIGFSLFETGLRWGAGRSEPVMNTADRVISGVDIERTGGVDVSLIGGEPLIASTDLLIAVKRPYRNSGLIGGIKRGLGIDGTGGSRIQRQSAVEQGYPLQKTVGLLVHAVHQCQAPLNRHLRRKAIEIGIAGAGAGGTDRNVWPRLVDLAANRRIHRLAGVDFGLKPRKPRVDNEEDCHNCHNGNHACGDAHRILLHNFHCIGLGHGGLLEISCLVPSSTPRVAWNQSAATTASSSSPLSSSAGSAWAGAGSSSTARMITKTVSSSMLSPVTGSK